MTDREKMEYIVNTSGTCPPDSCGECPLKNGSCFGGRHYLRAKEWLENHKEEAMDTVDKTEVIKRLNAIEEEAKELRKIIEKKDSVQFKTDKFYVAIIDSAPYLLVGDQDGRNFAWHNFFTDEPCCVCQTWNEGHLTGQAALDSIEEYDIHEFSDIKKGLKFFAENYRGK